MRVLDILFGHLLFYYLSFCFHINFPISTCNQSVLYALLSSLENPSSSRLAPLRKILCSARLLNNWSLSLKSSSPFGLLFFECLFWPPNQITFLRIRSLLELLRSLEGAPAGNGVLFKRIWFGCQRRLLCGLKALNSLLIMRAYHAHANTSSQPEKVQIQSFIFSGPNQLKSN